MLQCGKGEQEAHRKLGQDGLAVAGLQAGQVGMVCGGEADARHINEAAAVIRHGSHVLQQAEGIHTVCCGHQCLQARGRPVKCLF